MPDDSADLIHLSVPAEPKKKKRKPKPKDGELTTKDPSTLHLGDVKTCTIGLWEDKWSEKELRAARNDIGQREFDRGFRQMPISEEDLIFPPEIIEQCKDRNAILVDYIQKGSMYDSLIRFCGVDLAVADAESAGSFFVATVIGVDRNMHRWLLWIERHRGLSFKKQFDIICDLQVRFGMVLTKVESNAYQRALERHISESNKAGFSIQVPVEGYTTTALSKKDLEFGVPSLGIEFEQGRWHLPIGDARSKRMLAPVFEELAVFPLPGYRDDTVMSLFFSREAHAVEQFPTAHVVSVI